MTSINIFSKKLIIIENRGQENIEQIKKFLYFIDSFENTRIFSSVNTSSIMMNFSIKENLKILMLDKKNEDLLLRNRNLLRYYDQIIFFTDIFIEFKWKEFIKIVPVDEIAIIRNSKPISYLSKLLNLSYKKILKNHTYLLSQNNLNLLCSDIHLSHLSNERKFLVYWLNGNIKSINTKIFDNLMILVKRW